MNNYTKLGLIACAIILLGVLGFAYFDKTNPSQNFITNKDNNLDAETQAAFEKRLAELNQKYISTTNDDEKYTILMQIGADEFTLGHLLNSKLAFEQAIKIKSDKANAYLGLFQTQVDMKDNDGATNSIRKAVELNPMNQELWNRYIGFVRGVLNASNQEVDDLYQQALIKTNSNIDVVSSYAQFLEGTGNSQGALDYWKKLAEVRPDNQVYKDEVMRLEKLIKEQ